MNWGHDSQNYVTSSISYRVQTTLNEFSGAYVSTPMETKRSKSFLLPGGGRGVLVFNPDNTLIAGNPQGLEGGLDTEQQLPA